MVKICKKMICSFLSFLSKRCLSSIHQGSTPVNECRRKMIDAFLFPKRIRMYVGKKREDGGLQASSSKHQQERAKIEHCCCCYCIFGNKSFLLFLFYRILDGLWRWAACFACCYIYVVTNSATVHWVVVPLPPQLSNRRDLHTACKYRQSKIFLLLPLLLLTKNRHYFVSFLSTVHPSIHLYSRHISKLMYFQSRLQ